MFPPLRSVDNVARGRGGSLCQEAHRVDAVDQVDHPRVDANDLYLVEGEARDVLHRIHRIQTTFWHAFLPLPRFVLWSFIQEAHRHTVRLEGVTEDEAACRADTRSGKIGVECVLGLIVVMSLLYQFGTIHLFLFKCLLSAPLPRH